MKRFFFGFFLLFTTTLLFAQKERKAVFVIVDGVPHDVIEKLSPPHFAAIAREGGFAKAMVGGERGGYSETPTISAVGYNSVLTGTWANKHNVWDNDIAAPNYHYPTIFRLLKESRPEKKIGIFSSWLDNRTKLVGDGKPETGNIRFDFHLDSLEHDTLTYPHDKERAFMHRIDERVTDEAARVIRTEAPDLSWVYLEYTDDMGHRYGDSPQFYKAMEYADAQVGRIWEAIQHRQKAFGEEWLMVVTTDHGRDVKTGKGHGGQSDRERAGWILTNAKGLNSRFHSGQAAIVDVMPTIARFMNIPLPEAVAREVDGVPLIGKLSVTDPVLQMENGQTVVKWKVVDKKGKVRIWLSDANEAKRGGNDTYRLMSTVPVSAGKVILPKDLPASFYKLVLEAPHNRVNLWMTETKKANP